VLISSWSRCDPYMRAVFEHFKKMRRVASPANFTQLLQLWIASPPYYEEQFERMVQDQGKVQDNYMPLDAFEAQCDACCQHNTYDRLKSILVPVLLTVGDADIFTPMRLTAEIHERMPNSEMLVFPGRGHIHHWEDLKLFNEATLRFLLK
jgi:pimeloyl-ACP methyl ester carboxylesterase